MAISVKFQFAMELLLRILMHVQPMVPVSRQTRVAATLAFSVHSVKIGIATV